MDSFRAFDSRSDLMRALSMDASCEMGKVPVVSIIVAIGGLGVESGKVGGEWDSRIVVRRLREICGCVR